MARYSQRPENALKRANEFIEVGKPARALETLYEVFRNKKWAYNWSESILEPIMFKYLDLCVELKKSHIAKEGLFQYRNMFQTVNVGSLENVIRGYLRTAEEKTESAREHSHQAVIDIDDLDNLATPESILLSAVSGEGAQDRSDRTILTPWVKFLWESYCQCLELLRTNTLVETLYHDIARMAYQFCLKYNRKTEFRKLCDKLRKHLEDISKLPPQAINVSLSRQETQQYNLETRLIQLDYAIQMELWQEAYKATEDIHNLMTMSKKPPVPKMMANYYQKLAMVFWKAGPAYYLFHAAALFKLFQLNKEMKKNITQEDLQKMASRVLLATLAIPLPSAHPEFDRFIETDKSPLEKAQKLAVLLTLSQPPTRASLLKDLVRYNVLNMASPVLQELYNWLEVTFSPLQLCSKVDGLIKLLQDSDQYVPPLRDVTLVTLIRQVSQVYETINYNRLLHLSHFGTQFQMERLLVECVRQNDMQIRIDHSKGCIYFGADLAESQREDKLEGVTIQSMPSEQIRSQLINMNDVLNRCLLTINPNYNKAERENFHAAMVKRYHETKYAEHQSILARHKIIEERKEYLEQMNTVREQEEAKKLEELARAQALAEQKRLEIEREERERKRHLNEVAQIKERTLREKINQISLTAHGQKLLKQLQDDGQELKNLDADKIAAREAEELQKERKEQQQKLKMHEKRLDYFERAKRLEEIPLLTQAAKEKQEQDRKFWQQQEVDKIAMMKQERKFALQHRDRLKRMAEDYNIFLNKLKGTSYKEKLNQYEEDFARARKEALEKRKQERIEKRRIEYQRQIEEEQERKRQEERHRQEEEERKKREEEIEKERKLREEQDRIAAISRKREEEVLKKQEARDAERKGKDSTWRRGEGPARKEEEPSRAPPPAKENNWRVGLNAPAPTAAASDSGAYERPKPMNREERPEPRMERGPPPSRDSHEYRDSRDVREGRDNRDFREGRDGRDNREGRDNRDNREGRDNRDNREGRDNRDNREGRDNRDSKMECSERPMGRSIGGGGTAPYDKPQRTFDNDRRIERKPRDEEPSSGGNDKSSWRRSNAAPSSTAGGWRRN